VQRLHAIWRELEALSGRTILTQTGGLIMARATVTVRTASATYTAAQVVVAAGAWLPEFLGQAAADFSAERMPIFIWMYGDGQEDYMYGFPSADPARPALKVATEQYRRRVAGRFRTSAVALSMRGPACTRSRATVTSWSTPLPGSPRVLVAPAFSGHGFKHSAGLGEAIAQRVLGLGSADGLHAFAYRQP
jgi:sarcosine oxidase